MSNALAHLNSLADQNKRQQHPTVPYLPRSKFEDKTANGLTQCIVKWFALNDHFTSRIQSTGLYREDLKKFVPSQQRAGMPDVFAVVNGHTVFVEVKIGADRLSDVQKSTISNLIRSGASVFVARDFQGFYDWYMALFPTLTDADTLPFGPTPRDQN